MAELSLKELLHSYEDPAALIERTDKEYHASLAAIAQQIIDKDVRVLLLAGPSGSGKTTSANLIADAIRARGHEASVISLDNFYRAHDDPLYPRLENGERDMESADALNIPQIKEVIGQILGGEPFFVPRYDFTVAAPLIEGYSYKPMRDGCVVMEGLHALNPALTDSLTDAHLMKLFISVSTNINSDTGRILSGRKMRFCRRMVRDFLYRGSSLERTLGVWFSVLEGEDKYLYPFRDTADIQLNTFHPYEVGLMRPYVMRLLSIESEDGVVMQSPYVREVIEGISAFSDIDESLVPQNSLMREFIPGGIYEALY